MDKKNSFIDLWEIQKKFTEKFWGSRGGLPKDEAALTAVTKDYALHLIKEVTEIFDELSWKMHRAPKDRPDRSNVLEEIVDCQKFLFGLAQIWGFTPQQYVSEFLRKSMVVEQRWAQEQAMSKFRHDPCVLVDIDGVLAEYPGYYYDYVAKDLGLDSRDEAEKALAVMGLVDKSELKRKYRESGAKRMMPVLSGAKDMLEKFRSMGLRVILLTNRPYAEHYRIYPDTLEWLEKNRLFYDAIIWARDKGIEAVKNFEHIAFAIDDDYANIGKLKGAGVKTVLIRGEFTTKVFSRFIADMLPLNVGADSLPAAWEHYCWTKKGE